MCNIIARRPTIPSKGKVVSVKRLRRWRRRNPAEKPFPSKEIVFAAVALLFPILNEGYETAIGKARDYFFGRESINPDTFPCLVRDALVLYLTTSQFPIELTVRTLSNNGVELRYNGYVFRFRMSWDGRLAPPGRSLTLQAHYQQASLEFASLPPCQLELPFPPTDLEYNLVVVWQVDRAYLFKGLFLAAPKDGDETQVEVHWIEPIPYLGRQSVQSASGPVGGDPQVTDDFIQLDDGRDLDAEDDSDQTESGQDND